MALKLYFLASDYYNGVTHEDLWWTDGTTTQAVGGGADAGVSGADDSGLGPEYLTAFGQQMIFAGSDTLAGANSNGIWLTDDGSDDATEVGGVSPGPGHPSSITNADPSGLDPDDFVSFGNGALFFGTDTTGFRGLWSTTGAVSGTTEIGGLENGKGTTNILFRGDNWDPTNFAAFGSFVAFNAFDSSGTGEYEGLWVTDGTTAGTQEIGGLQNAAIYDSNASEFEAINGIALGDSLLFDAQNKAGDETLWITDGTAIGTTEIGGANNAGVVGANNTGLGDGMANAVRFGARIFFNGLDIDNANGLWFTDSTASGTQEVGGLEDGALPAAQHPSSLGLNPTDLTVNGQAVLFNGRDALSFQELWVSDGTSTGTYEIGGEGVGGALANEASNGVNPYSIVSLGNGKAVFIGYDDSNNQASGKATLWVTDGTFAGTEEVGLLADNQGVSGINSTGFDFTSDLIGGDGLAYFIGEDADGDSVLWETDGTTGGTKVVPSPAGITPSTGLLPSESGTWALAAPPPASGGGEVVNLDTAPGQSATLTATDNTWDTVTGSNGALTFDDAQAYVIGGGILISLVAIGNSMRLSHTNGNKDSVYGTKGAITLVGAQANVFGGKNTITFAANTTGNVVYLFDTQGRWDTVNGSNGAVHLNSAQSYVTGGGDVVYFDGGLDDAVSLSATGGAWDAVHGFNGIVEVNAAQVSIVGSGTTVYATAGSSVSLYTGGMYDAVNGSQDAFILTGSSATITGGQNTITADAASFVSLYGTKGAWDLVNGSGEKVAVTSAQAAIVGGGVTIYATAGSSVSLENTNGKWDGFNGSSDQVNLVSAQAAITGGSDVIYANAGSTASLYGTAGNWDVFYGSGDAVILTASQSEILGGYDTISATAGSSVSLYDTGTHADVFTGGGDALYLNSAETVLNGSANVEYFFGSSALAANGLYEALYFGANLGVSSISGFNTSDVLHLSAADWSSFAALQASHDLFQSGANTIIQISASDTLALLNTNISTLSATDVKFA